MHYYPFLFPAQLCNICSCHLLILRAVCFHLSDSHFFFNVCVTECLHQSESCNPIDQPTVHLFHSHPLCPCLPLLFVLVSFLSKVKAGREMEKRNTRGRSYCSKNQVGSACARSRLIWGGFLLSKSGEKQTGAAMHACMVCEE